MRNAGLATHCRTAGSSARRMSAKDVEEVAGGLQVTAAAVIEAEGGSKPVCIAEPVFRFYGG
jgi:hypothetical protein